MTASKPKKVNRTIDLDINPDQTFLLYGGYNGGILWTRAVPFSRDEAGKPWVDITDLLREADVPFTFCEQAPSGTIRRVHMNYGEQWTFLAGAGKAPGMGSLMIPPLVPRSLFSKKLLYLRRGDPSDQPGRIWLVVPKS